jgi:hypothetical protein
MSASMRSMPTRTFISRGEFDAAGERPGKAASAYWLNAAQKGARRCPTDPGAATACCPCPPVTEGFLALYDSNGDGKVSRIEYDQDRAAQFARSDRNHDGELDRAEYAAEYRARIDARAAELDKREDRQAHVRFGVLDTDKDRKMTFVEYQASGKRLFDTADRNRDGVIDAADAVAAGHARARPLPSRTAASTDFGQLPIHPMQRRCRSDSRHRRRHQPRPRHDTALLPRCLFQQRAAPRAHAARNAPHGASPHYLTVEPTMKPIPTAGPDHCRQPVAPRACPRRKRPTTPSPARPMPRPSTRSK